MSLLASALREGCGELLRNTSMVGVAYVGVIVTWGSSPLAIKWSGEGVGFLFGATARVVLAFAFAWLVCAAFGLRFRLDRQALTNYVAGGIGIGGTTLSLYWGAQFIPSGWVAVLLGTTPFVSAVIARRVLSERLGGVWRVAGMGVALIGVAVIFLRGVAVADNAGYAVAVVLLATVFHSTSMVIINRYDSGVPPLMLITGSLCVASLPLVAVWVAFDGEWPQEVSLRTGAAIVYAAVLSTVVGLGLYFYVLRELGPTRVAFVTLLTPVLALVAGHWANGEVMDLRAWAGAAMVVLGTWLFERPNLYAARRQSHENH